MIQCSLCLKHCVENKFSTTELRSVLTSVIGSWFTYCHKLILDDTKDWGVRSYLPVPRIILFHFIVKGYKGRTSNASEIR